MWTEAEQNLQNEGAYRIGIAATVIRKGGSVYATDPRFFGALSSSGTILVGKAVTTAAVPGATFKYLPA